MSTAPVLALIAALLTPAAACAAKPWERAETVSRSPGTPSATIDAQGNAVLAWSGASRSARNGVFGVRRTARGFGAPFGLRAQNSSISGAAAQASAAGEVPIAYRRYVPSNHRVESATVRADGSRTSPFSLSGSGSSAYDPRFASVAAGTLPARPVLTWWRRETDRAQIARAVDGRLLVSADATIRNAPDASYAQRTNGRLEAASTTATSVFIQSASADDTFGAPVTVASGAGPFRDAHIAAGPAGTLAIAWREYDGTTFRARFAVAPANAPSFQAPITVSAANERAIDPRVFITSRGAVRVAYIATPAANDRPNGRAGPLKLFTLGGSVQTLTSGSEQASAFQIGGDATGETTLAWRRRRQGGQGEILSRAIAPSGSIGRSQQLTAAGERASSLSLAVGPRGHAVVAWTTDSALRAAWRPGPRRR